MIFAKVPTIEKTEFLTGEDVREYCIRNGYYTHGDTKAYGDLLRYTDRTPGMSIEKVYNIAVDIAAHSDMYDSDDMETTYQNIEGIMDGLYKAGRVSVSIEEAWT